MGWISALVGGGLGLIGGERANSANAREAAATRAFNERMAKNKHQYETEDLKKAGLNRILSSTQGATAGSSSAQATHRNSLAEGVSSAASAASLQLTKAQTRLTNEKTVSEQGLPQNIVGAGVGSAKQKTGLNTGDLALGGLAAYGTSKAISKGYKAYKKSRKFSGSFNPKTGEIKPKGKYKSEKKYANKLRKMSPLQRFKSMGIRRMGR